MKRGLRCCRYPILQRNYHNDTVLIIVQQRALLLSLRRGSSSAAPKSNLFARQQPHKQHQGRTRQQSHSNYYHGKRITPTITLPSETRRTFGASTTIDGSNTDNTKFDRSSYLYSPIIIIGGGPCGLFLSNLLCRYKVPFLLLDASSVQERFKHPQAHFLNTRSMELFRNALPSRAYEEILTRMPPVQQWKHFQFGYNMKSSGAAASNNILAKVEHPVQYPILESTDCNGVLLPPKDEQQQQQQHHKRRRRPLSPCTVGHLAQHTFCKILYNSANIAIDEQVKETISNCSSSVSSSMLKYDTKVTRVDFLDPTADGSYNEIIVHTTNTSGSSSNATTTTDANTGKYLTNLVVAADGAHSPSRRFFFPRDKIQMKGKKELQHLINIHVKVKNKEWAWNHLHENGNNCAMLYSVFHPRVVAMIVCHTIGEYVLQIPYFPPYQSPYQAYDNEAKIRELVYSAMGIEDNNAVADDIVEIVSFRTWTMNSLVAERYYSASTTNNCPIGGVLVGDAAHAFPPAGGFGMNTGLQDAFCLAWKLSWLYHNHIHRKQKPYNDNDNNHQQQQHPNQDYTNFYNIFRSYSNERRPVAQQNAALSVRNYQRLLQVTKACYLYEQHPQQLIKLLNMVDHGKALLSTPGPLSTMSNNTNESTSSVFNQLFQTALYPLSFLNNNNHFYTRHIRQNIRDVLSRGGGLPLLFPNHELRFCYPTKDHPDTTNNNHNSSSKNNNEHRENDTMSFTPKIQVGYLFPHVLAQIMSHQRPQVQENHQAFIYHLKQKYPHLRPLSNNENDDNSAIISTCDLPSQLSQDGKPCFVAVIMLHGSSSGSDNEDDNILGIIQQASKNASQKLGIPFELVQIVFEEPKMERKQEKDLCFSDNDNKSSILLLREVPFSSNDAFHPIEEKEEQILKILKLTQKQKRQQYLDQANIGDGASYCVYLVRPDSHVAGCYFSNEDNGDGKSTINSLERKLFLDAKYALLGDDNVGKV